MTPSSFYRELEPAAAQRIQERRNEGRHLRRRRGGLAGLEALSRRTASIRPTPLRERPSSAARPLDGHAARPPLPGRRSHSTSRSKRGTSQLDQLDLLFKLRDLLADDLDVPRRVPGECSTTSSWTSSRTPTRSRPRSSSSSASASPRATRWQDVELAAGQADRGRRPQAVHLPLPPRRRRDVRPRPRASSRRHRHLEVTLSANFRSVPPLIEWFNDRFDRILKTSPDGTPFDPGDRAGLPAAARRRPRQATSPPAGPRAAFGLPRRRQALRR